MVETKTQRKERLRAMRQKYHLGEYKGYAGHSKVVRRNKSRGGTMARRGRRRSSGGGSFGMGGLLSTKNILGTVAGAYIAPKFGLDPKLGAAGGSYLIGKKGVMGAAVGYFAAPYILGMLGGVIGGSTTGNGNDSTQAW